MRTADEDNVEWAAVAAATTGCAGRGRASLEAAVRGPSRPMSISVGNAARPKRTGDRRGSNTAAKACTGWAMMRFYI
jgi:hypothetical protein